MMRQLGIACRVALFLPSRLFLVRHFVPFGMLQRKWYPETRAARKTHLAMRISQRLVFEMSKLKCAFRKTTPASRFSNFHIILFSRRSTSERPIHRRHYNQTRSDAPRAVRRNRDTLASTAHRQLPRRPRARSVCTRPLRRYVFISDAVMFWKFGSGQLPNATPVTTISHKIFIIVEFHFGREVALVRRSHSQRFDCDHHQTASSYSIPQRCKQAYWSRYQSYQLSGSFAFGYWAFSFFSGFSEISFEMENQTKTKKKFLKFNPSLNDILDFSRSFSFRTLYTM